MSHPLDLLVAGAGIAGLHVATRYLKKHPSHSVLVVERNRLIGGRVSTHHETVKGKGKNTIYQLEAGAGRISTTHTRVIGLIKAYGLTFQPWHAPKGLVDPFPDLAGVYLPPLLRLPPAVLGATTLDTLLEKVYGPTVADSFMCMFPYCAEMRTLRSDIALDAFLKGPLGSSSEGWGGCAEGLSALTDRMGEDVRERGGVIRLRTSLVEVHYHQKGVEVCVHEKDQKEREWLTCKKLVVALDAGSLRHVKGLGSKLPVLRHLTSEPLLRVYAVFPVGGDESAKGKPWFAGMAKEVVPGPIRFFIPMDAPALLAGPDTASDSLEHAEKGVAMISYTEGRDALHWMRFKDKGARQRAMMAALRCTFPDKEIPDPLAIFFYGWEQGCTYWLPSKDTASAYSVEEASSSSVQPFPKVPLYLCGESFAVQQSWMESALVQADRVLGRLGAE